MLKNKFTFLFIFSLFFVFISCESFKHQNLSKFSNIENSSKQIDWKKINEGVWISHLYYDYPLIVHFVKIDLTNPKLKIIVTGPNKLNDKKKAFKRETALVFAKRHNTTIAVNAAFFKTKSLLFSNFGTPLGIHIYKGQILNPFNKRFGLLCFSKNNEVIIVDGQDEEKIKNAYYAVSGLKMILKNGKPIITKIHNVEDSRTCVGISKDKKTLFFVFVDAENKQKSRGTTYDQVAFFMQKIGAYDAIHLDGGGSSSLIVKTQKGFSVEAPTTALLGLRKVVTNLGFIIEE